MAGRANVHSPHVKENGRGLGLGERKGGGPERGVL